MSAVYKIKMVENEYNKINNDFIKASATSDRLHLSSRNLFRSSRSVDALDFFFILPCPMLSVGAQSSLSSSNKELGLPRKIINISQNGFAVGRRNSPEKHTSSPYTFT